MDAFAAAISTKNNVVPCLLDSLQNLQRHSSNLFGLTVQGRFGLTTERCTGNLQALKQRLDATALSATIGIAHTGINEHRLLLSHRGQPQVSHGSIGVVHYGQLDNITQIRNYLLAHGYCFDSQTSTEVIAHFIHHFQTKHMSLVDAVKEATNSFSGKFAMVVISHQNPEHLVAAQSGAPLFIGQNADGHVVASHLNTLNQCASNVVLMQEGDLAIVNSERIRLINNRQEFPFHSPLKNQIRPSRKGRPQLAKAGL